MKSQATVDAGVGRRDADRAELAPHGTGGAIHSCFTCPTCGEALEEDLPRACHALIRPFAWVDQWAGLVVAMFLFAFVGGFRCRQHGRVPSKLLRGAPWTTARRKLTALGLATLVILLVAIYVALQDA